MQDEQSQTQGAATDEVEGTQGEGNSEEFAASVDQQAATSDGTAAESAPEVPDGASETMQRAQDHIDKLNMDAERAAAKRAM